jgi:hypothetical protein
LASGLQEKKARIRKLLDELDLGRLETGRIRAIEGQKLAFVSPILRVLTPVNGYGRDLL